MTTSSEITLSVFDAVKFEQSNKQLEFVITADFCQRCFVGAKMMQKLILFVFFYADVRQLLFLYSCQNFHSRQFVLLSLSWGCWLYFFFPDAFSMTCFAWEVFQHNFFAKIFPLFLSFQILEKQVGSFYPCNFEGALNSFGTNCK